MLMDTDSPVNRDELEIVILCITSWRKIEFQLNLSVTLFYPARRLSCLSRVSLFPSHNYNQSSTFQPGHNPSCHRKNLFLTTILNTTRRCHHLELVQWFCPSPLATLDIDMKAANDSFVQHTNGILSRKINILSPGILSFYWPLTRLGLVEK